MGQQYKTFDEFYPFYLSQHSNMINRRLHVIGTFLSTINLIWAVLFFSPINIIYALLIGYGLAWIGHFFFEKNKPATFKYPLFSLIGDYKMCIETVVGKRKF